MKNEAEGEGWCERFSGGRSEESVKMGWTHGTYGREQLMKTADVLRVEGRWRKGRPV